MTEPTPLPADRPPLSIGDALSYGWNAYWANVGPLLLITAVVVVVNLALGAVAQSTDSVPSLVVLQVLSFVIGIVVAMGLVRASLAVTEGRMPELRMLGDTEGFVPYLAATILVTIGVVAGLILLIVPGIMLALMWQFYGYVIVEEPGTRATDAMRRSAEMTAGSRWQLLGLGLVLFGINLVGALAFGVGLIFTYGITAVTVAGAYKTLSGRPPPPVTRSF